MHTAHSLTVSPSMLYSGGCLVPGGTCMVPGGCLHGPGGCLHGPGGCLPGPGGMPAWSGGCLIWGVPGPRGCLPGPRGVVSQHALRQTPLWTEFLTHASENITLPQTSFAVGNKDDTISFFKLDMILSRRELSVKLLFKLNDIKITGMSDMEF